MIVSVGNLGGFVGPFMVGALRQHTKRFTAPLLLLFGAIVMALVGDPARKTERSDA